MDAASDIRFDTQGLVPCVMQDSASGEVLTVAYMNDEALRLTRETGEMHFWSRSREEIWHKGATSGNVMRVCELRFDCDEDALVALVDAGGPACHTGARSCFHRELETGAAPRPAVFEQLSALERTLRERASERPDGSYTVQLLDDSGLIGEKVREEAEEVARAAAGESDERVAEEAADVIYHLLVLLRSREVDLAAVLEVLDGRRR